jgi:hypothetical protein
MRRIRVPLEKSGSAKRNTKIKIANMLKACGRAVPASVALPQGTRAIDCGGTPSFDGHRLCIAHRWAGLTMSVVRGRPEVAFRGRQDRF